MSERRQRFVVGPSPAVDVRIPAGDVRIVSGEEGAIEVRLQGGERNLARIEMVQRGDTVEIFTEQRFSLFGGIDATISVPPSTGVSAHLASSDLSVETEASWLKAGLVSGDVRARDVTGDVQVSTASGDITIDGVGGELRLKVASGDVRVGRVDADAQVKLASGDIRIDSARGRFEVSAATGDVRVRSYEGGAFVCRNMAGDVIVGFPKGRMLHLDLQTLSGDVFQEFGAGAEAGAAGAEAKVKIKTVSGDIRLVSA